MVQARWGHLNREHSLLTRTQALMLDGHHLVENRARSAAGWLFNFSGTGRHLAQGGHRVGRRLAARHAHRGPRPLLPRAARRAGASSTARTSSPPPSCPRTSAPSARSSSAGPRAPCRPRASSWRRLMRARAHADAAGRGVLPPDAALRLPAHGAAQRAAPAGARPDAGDEPEDDAHDRPAARASARPARSPAFYAMAEAAQGRSALGALRRLPALLALGAGLAPHLTKAVWEGLRSMAGEFVRTPKKGMLQGRYRAAADLPIIEIALCLISGASTVASLETGHWFATPVRDALHLRLRVRRVPRRPRAARAAQGAAPAGAARRRARDRVARSRVPRRSRQAVALAAGELERRGELDGGAPRSPAKLEPHAPVAAASRPSPRFAFRLLAYPAGWGEKRRS